MSDLRVSVCCGVRYTTKTACATNIERWFVCDHCLKECSVETIAQRDHRMRVEGAREPMDALAELVEVAGLRGDNVLPHPADDPKLWTARMQTAWHEAERIVAGSEASNGSA